MRSLQYLERPPWGCLIPLCQDIRKEIVSNGERLSLTDMNSTALRETLKMMGISPQNEWAVYGLIASQCLIVHMSDKAMRSNPALLEEYFQDHRLGAMVVIATLWDLIPEDVR